MRRASTRSAIIRLRSINRRDTPGAIRRGSLDQSLIRSATQRAAFRPGCDSPYQDDLAAVAPSPLPAAEYGELDHGHLFNYGYGSGPVYLTGQLVWYESGNETAIMVDPSVRVPVTVSFTGPAGSSATFEGEPTVTIAPTANGWPFVEGRLMPTAAGCWTMQATYGSNTEMVAFTVAPGSPPPG